MPFARKCVGNAQLTDLRVEIPAELRAELAGRRRDERYYKPGVVWHQSGSPTGDVLCVGEGSISSDGEPLRRLCASHWRDRAESTDTSAYPPSRLERILGKQYKASGRNLVRDQVRLSALELGGSRLVSPVATICS